MEADRNLEFSAILNELSELKKGLPNKGLVSMWNQIPTENLGEINTMMETTWDDRTTGEGNNTCKKETGRKEINCVEARRSYAQVAAE